MKLNAKIWGMSLVVLLYCPLLPRVAFGNQQFQNMCMEAMTPLSGSNPEVQRYLEDLCEKSVREGGPSGWVRLLESMQTLRNHSEKGSLFRFRGPLVKKIFEKDCMSRLDCIHQAVSYISKKNIRNLEAERIHILLSGENISHGFVHAIADGSDYAYAAISLLYAHAFAMEEQEPVLYAAQFHDDLVHLSVNGVKGEFVGRMADKGCRNDLQCFHIVTEAIAKMALNIEASVSGYQDGYCAGQGEEACPNQR